jgi:hypothetical protein
MAAPLPDCARFDRPESLLRCTVTLSGNDRDGGQKLVFDGIAGIDFIVVARLPRFEDIVGVGRSRDDRAGDHQATATAPEPCCRGIIPIRR